MAECKWASSAFKHAMSALEKEASLRVITPAIGNTKAHGADYESEEEAASGTAGLANGSGAAEAMAAVTAASGATAEATAVVVTAVGEMAAAAMATVMAAVIAVYRYRSQSPYP